MGVWSFISCTRHRWRKTKEQKPWNNTKQIFPWTDNKEAFCFTSFVSSTRGFDRSLEAIVCTNCQFIWSGKCTFGCHDQSRNFKNYASGNHVSTSSCMLRIEKLITCNMTCAWTLKGSFSFTAQWTGGVTAVFSCLTLVSVCKLRVNVQLSNRRSVLKSIIICRPRSYFVDAFIISTLFNASKPEKRRRHY